MAYDKKETEQFQKGWCAYTSGKLLNDCPYEKDSQNASLWCYGFFEASRDSLAQIWRMHP